MFRLTTLTIFALAATFVAAQTIPVCVQGCSTIAAASAGCASTTDLPCVCTNVAYQTAAGSCIQQTCPDQLQAALTLQQQLCAGVIPPIVPSGTPSSTGSSNIATQSQTSQISALPGATPTSSTTGSAQESSTALNGAQNPPTGAIVGGVIGGVLVLMIIIGTTLWYLRRKRNHHPNNKDAGIVHIPEVFENHTYERSNGTLPPWAVPLGPSTTVDQPITNSSERGPPSSNPSQQASSSWKFSPYPPSDSLILGSSSIPPQPAENDPRHSPPPYPPAPRSDDAIPVPLSPRPPTYLTIDAPAPQPSQPEFAPSMAQNIVGRTLTDADIEAIAWRVSEMHRDRQT